MHSNKLNDIDFLFECISGKEHNLVLTVTFTAVAPEPTCFKQELMEEARSRQGDVLWLAFIFHILFFVEP